MKSKMAATTEAESVREELVFNQDFKEKLLFKLHELRNDNFLCDVTLRIEGKDFAAHRCVLSAASPSRGVDSHMKQTGMLVGNFEFNP